MDDLAQRIAALSPEKLALLERRLERRHSQNGELSGALPDIKPQFPVRQEDAEEPNYPLAEAVETQAVLEQCPAIKEVTCVFRECGSRGCRLIAYVVPDRKRSHPIRQVLRLQAEDALRNHSHYELPNGMVVIHLNRSETDYIYREIFEEQSYLKHGVTLPERACVFDAGAHIGLFTLFVSQVTEGAEIYAFEPVPPIFDVLQFNSEIYEANVKLFNVGLAKESGAACFSYYPHASVLSGRYADASAERETVRTSLHTQQRLGIGDMGLSDIEIDEILDARLSTIQFTCPVKTLSDIIQENGVEQIDLLKIDVEKSELDVLGGINDEDWPKIRQLVIEAHDIEGRLKLITDSLTSRGFQLTVEQDAMLKETGIYNIYAVRQPVSETPSITDVRSSVRNPGWIWRSPEEFINEVRQFAVERLPSHLTPDEFVLLNELPRTPDGEVLQSALPPAEPSASPEGKETRGDFAEWPTVTVSTSRESDTQSQTNGTHLDGSAMVEGDEQTVSHIDRLSDEDVNSWLGHLLAEERGAAETGETRLALNANRSEPGFQVIDAISRVGPDSDTDLLANLNRLSDDEVDLMLASIFTEEEILKEHRAMKSDPTTWTQDESISEKTLAEPGSRSRVRTGAETASHAYSETAGGINSAFEAAYLTYVNKLQEAWMNAQQLAASARFAYMMTPQPTWAEFGTQRASDAAYQKYVEALQVVRDQTQQHFEDAYVDYLSALKEAWVQPGIVAIAPDLLFAVSQQMSMAAHFAGRSLDSLPMIGG